VPFLPEEVARRDERAAVEELKAIIVESVSRRMRSDVPVAAFLSGGVDSATVAALLARGGNLHTFTVSLPGQPGDEARAARAIAEHLGAKHTEVGLNLGEDTDWLEQALDAMDVPSIDGPNVWLVSRAAREAGFKVACSGLGGDELFFGYPTFHFVPRAVRCTRFLSPLRTLRPTARSLMRRLPAIPRYSRAVDALLSGGGVAAWWLAKRGLFSEAEVRELLEAEARDAMVQDAVARVESLGMPAGLATERQVSFLELGVYMHDQLLRDSDVMGMAHGVEVRIPLIARPVVEAVARLSAGLLRGSGPKWLLREIGTPLLPEGALHGPKRGFTLNWPSILCGTPLPTEPVLPGFLKAGTYTRERQRLCRGKAGFARLFSFEVLRRKLGASPHLTAPSSTGGYP
jgi:asparagine synthase (glutamine-hydrolysing)